MKKEDKNTQPVDYGLYMEDIKDLVAKVTSFIDEHSNLKDMNFGLFYQHGRLGFVNLDAFAESTKARLNVDGKEKSLAELKKDIDKKEK